MKKTKQNRSYAVMQQRIEPNDALDDFPTPPWATRAFIEHIIYPRFNVGLGLGTVWEPACNRGYMARPLQEYFEIVYSSDVHAYGFGDFQVDFLWPGAFPSQWMRDAPDWIITNPPFRLAEEFIAKAATIAKVGLAILVRTSFLESEGRYARLFSEAPPTIIAQYVERVPMVKGRCDPEASTATSYCWLVWAHGYDAEPFQWIPPSRTRLERKSDYGSEGSTRKGSGG